MGKDDLHGYLLGALQKRIPEQTKLVTTLTDILFLERGSVYRRLRGEVDFTFSEIVKMSEKLNLSLNNFIHTDSEQTNHFKLPIIDYANMNEVSYKEWEDYIYLISSAKDDPQSELAELSNLLPLSICTKFDSLLKYYQFKYQYLFHESEGRLSFGDTVIPDRLHQIYQSYFTVSKDFAHTIYIWDYLMFQYLVTDIRFFFDIKLISSDDICEIRKDLLALLDYVEEIAFYGCFQETGNPVSLYISDVNISTGCSYIQLNDSYISHVRAFILNSVTSTDQSSFMKMKRWIHSLKKSSTLITESGTAFRAEFFEKQRMVISEM